MAEPLLQSRYTLFLTKIGNPEKKRQQVVTARNKDEASRKGKLIAGWEVASVSEAKSGGNSMFSSFSGSSSPRKLPNVEVVRFCRGFAIMLRAGIPTVEALNFYAGNLNNKDTAALIRGIASDIESGDPPAAAFAKTGKFSNLFVGLVKAGVTSGHLDNALDAIAHQITMLTNFRKRLRRVIATPAAVLIFLACVFITAQNLITPKIEAMLASNRVGPDPFSAAIFAMSHFVQKTWIALPVILVVGAVVLATQRGLRAAFVALIMSKWSALRKLVMSVRQLTFISTLSMLQNNGISMDESLKNSADVMIGSPMAAEVRAVREQYLLGVPLGECVSKFTSCDPVVVHMIRLGEKAAMLPDQLASCAGMLEEQTKDSMDNFAEYASLISTVIPVLVIGLTFLSCYLPIILMSARLMDQFGGAH